MEVARFCLGTTQPCIVRQLEWSSNDGSDGSWTDFFEIDCVLVVVRIDDLACFLMNDLASKALLSIFGCNIAILNSD